MPFWTQKETQTAIDLWAQGKSASEIGLVLHISRNAVIGRLNRLGYRRAQQGVKSKVTDKRRRVFAAKRKKAVACLEAAPLPKTQANDTARVAHDDLEKHHCRFIPADIDPKRAMPGDKIFCGIKKEPGLAYCLAHALRCYQPIYLEKKGIDVSVPERESELV